MTQPMLSADDQLAIAAVITRFFWSLDHDAVDQLTELFDPGIRLDMGDRPAVEGHDGVMTLFGIRPPGRLVRHAWSSLMVGRADATGVDVSFLFMTHVKFTTGDDQAMKYACGDVAATFVKGADGAWRMTRMDRTPLFDA